MGYYSVIKIRHNVSLELPGDARSIGVDKGLIGDLLFMD
jgi:hypothetical protein